jgi:ferredoxin-type protein NapH
MQILVLALILSPLAGAGVFQGNLASALLFGVQLADPLAVLQVLLASRVAVPAFVGAALLVATAYFLAGGRTFCSWVCPVYLITELAGKLRGSSGENGLMLRLDLKSWALLLTLVVTFLTALPLFEILSPIGIVGRALVFGVNGSLLVLAVILLAEMFVARRVWCRSLCPAGGFYALMGSGSPVKVRYHRARCTGCGNCQKACPVAEVLAPSLTDGVPLVRSGECTRCGACIDCCPGGALSMGMGYK